MATNIEGDELQLEIEQVMKQIRKVQVNSDSVEAAIAGRGTYRGYSGEDVFLKNNLRLVQAQKMTQLQQRQRQLVEMKAKRPKSAVPSPPPASPATQFRGETASENIQSLPAGAGSAYPHQTCVKAPSSTDDTGPVMRDTRAESPLAESSSSKTGVMSNPVVRTSPASSSPVGTVDRSRKRTSSSDTRRESAKTSRIDNPGAAASSAGDRSDQNACAASSPAGSIAAAHSPDHTVGVHHGTNEANRQAAAEEKIIGRIACRALAGEGEEYHRHSSSRKTRLPPTGRKRAISGGMIRSRGSAGGYAAALRNPPQTKRELQAPIFRRDFKTSRREISDVPGPAHSVEGYLANTELGLEAAESIAEGTVFWIKFSDSKEAWLECGWVTKVHPRSARPYEVKWRPFDSSGIVLDENPQKRIALTPRLFISSPHPPELTEEADPPAGTAAWGNFKLSDKKFKLTVPPIGSWTIVEPHLPWGQLGPFAF